MRFTITGDVYLGDVPGPGYLGTVVPTSPVTVHRDGSMPVNFFIEVTEEQIRRVEERRSAQDGGFNISLSLRMEARAPDGRVDYQEAQLLPIRVGRDEWLTILNQVGYRRVIVAEIDVPDVATRPTLAKALGWYQQAQGRFLAGEYRETAENLRQALAALVGESGEDEELGKEDVSSGLRAAGRRTRDEGVGYDDRMELTRKALKFVADLGAHPEVDDTHRIEALAQLHMAAGLIQWFLQH